MADSKPQLLVVLLILFLPGLPPPTATIIVITPTEKAIKYLLRLKRLDQIVKKQVWLRTISSSVNVGWDWIETEFCKNKFNVLSFERWF